MPEAFLYLVDGLPLVRPYLVLWNMGPRMELCVLCSCRSMDGPPFVFSDDGSRTGFFCVLRTVVPGLILFVRDVDYGSMNESWCVLQMMGP